MVQIQGEPEINKIRIYNLTGQVVLEAAAVREFNVSNLVQGIYLVQIESVNGSINTLKLIKK